MPAIKELLAKLDFSEKEIAVYLTLLSLGPSPIRAVGARAGINRGTTHDALRALQREGLVAYYHKEKHQYFVAEDPNVLVNLIEKRKVDLAALGAELKEVVPQLRSLFSGLPERPAVKYYESFTGLRTILEDVLDSVAKLPKKEYVAYSASTIRPYLYHKDAFPNFTDERIKRKIYMRAISIGPGGGTHGNDERKWLTKEEGAPTYTLIYAGKVAMISVGKNGVPHGLIIEDPGLYETQLLLFNSLWKALKQQS